MVKRLTALGARAAPILRLEIVSPARSMLRFDAVGRASVDGHTVTKPGAVAAVAVTFMTTATTPAAGTPP